MGAGIRSHVGRCSRPSAEGRGGSQVSYSITLCHIPLKQNPSLTLIPLSPPHPTTGATALDFCMSSAVWIQILMIEQQTLWLTECSLQLLKRHFCDLSNGLGLLCFGSLLRRKQAWNDCWPSTGKPQANTAMLLSVIFPLIIHGDGKQVNKCDRGVPSEHFFFLSISLGRGGRSYSVTGLWRKDCRLIIIIF